MHFNISSEKYYKLFVRIFFVLHAEHVVAYNIKPHCIFNCHCHYLSSYLCSLSSSDITSIRRAYQHPLWIGFQWGSCVLNNSLQNLNHYFRALQQLIDYSSALHVVQHLAWYWKTQLRVFNLFLKLFAILLQRQLPQHFRPIFF